MNTKWKIKILFLLTWNEKYKIKHVNQEESAIEEAFKSVDINASGSVSKTVSKRVELWKVQKIFQDLLGPNFQFDFCLQLYVEFDSKPLALGEILIFITQSL